MKHGLRQADSGASITSTFVLPAQSGVTVEERRASTRTRRALAGLGQVGGTDWVDLYLSLRTQAAKKSGTFIAAVAGANEKVPNLSFEDAKLLLKWWRDRLDAVGHLGNSSESWSGPKWVENYEYITADDDYEWEQDFVIFSWKLMYQAAAHLRGAAVRRIYEDENTLARAFVESAKDIVGNGTDPFGVGAFFKGAKTVLIAGGVVVGGLVIWNVWRSARRVLPPSSPKPPQ